ncbi:hypothetical protein E1263_42430 [Kribbella antibiotica]|uniref:Transcriptional regulator, AbiEi antitoxin, Type IV TA system n=1 Tax=Kribbella antibiotica TaxID=190195 RepID=A0A4R4YCQ8_9ACTN|nr:hypothetical protein E1263_42430 [Kribbella antibiotica]
MEGLEIVRRPQPRDVLVRLGLGDADLRRLVRRGRLQHHHGHYIDGSIAADIAVSACAQAAHPGSVVSHFSAARLAGLSTWVDGARRSPPPYDATWLTRPPETPRNQRRRNLVVRRAGLAPEDVSRHGWLPVTSTARTVADLARELPTREAIVTVDDALRSGTTFDELAAVLERQEQWPGVRRARATIAFGDARAESALESIARFRCVAGGLPMPELQVQFFDGFSWMLERVDLWWPEFRTAGEADGLAKYDAATPQERRHLLRLAHRRDQVLSDRGIELVHFGWEDTVDPRSDLIPRLQTAFDRGRARPGPAPTWRVAPGYAQLAA